MKTKTDKAIAEIVRTIEGNPSVWILGFSGGKDSTALLLIMFRALKSISNLPPNFKLIVTFCDTGVEIPTTAKITKFNLAKFRNYAKAHGLPVFIKVASPKPKDRFFVKVIGRGYVPPTNKFRWCTNRLRIGPIETVLRRHESVGSLIVLGVREGESRERDRTIKRHSLGSFFLKQSVTNRTIFAPILNFNTVDVWNTILEQDEILGDGHSKLLGVYREASGECPLIRDVRSTPCGQGRFGCWTCTVVRKDVAVTGLVDSGHMSLAPLLEFRNWIAEIRDNKALRYKRRRNGAKGPGPFRLKTRRMILKKLLEAQMKSGHALISSKEIFLIKEEWAKDIRP